MSSQDKDLKKKLSVFYDLRLDDLEDEDKYPIYLKLSEIDKRYTSIELIGKGGMKSVYKVFDQASERELALAKPNNKEDRSSHEYFLREALLNSSLSHPNIMPIYDIGISEDRIPYFVMELKTEKNLKQILTQQPALSEEDALEIFIKVCDGISYTHANDILHLDLKPENIQVGKYGEVLICDWGCADYLIQEDMNHEEDQDHKSDLINLDLPSHQILGTPGYIAPEVLKSKKNLSVQSDIYALGVILYEMCYHRPPPKNPHISFNFSSSKVSSSLKAICQKALHKLPDSRYTSTEELKKDLETYIKGHIPSAHKAHLGIVLFKFIKRNAVFSIMSIAASMIIAFICILFIYSLNKSKNETEQALQDVIKQQEITKQLQYNLEESVVKEAFSLIYKGFYERFRSLDNEIIKLIEKLDHVTAQNPKNYQAWKAKGLLYFMTQRFNEAVECHKAIGDNLDIFYRDIAIELAYQKGEQRLLDLKDLANFVEQHLHYRDDIINYTYEKMLIYDYEMRGEEDTEGLLLRAHIKLINPDWDMSRFNYNHEKKVVVLGGKGLKILIPPDKQGSRRNVLQYYNILQIYFKECDFDDMKQLSDLSLTRLEIQHTKLSDFPKDELPSLDPLISLTVSEQQLKKNPYLSEMNEFRLFVKNLEQ